MIRRSPPSTAVLFAVWTDYDEDWASTSATAGAVGETLDALFAAGDSNIVVLGPAPKWHPDLPTVIYDDWYLQQPPRHVPQRLASGWSPTLRTGRPGHAGDRSIPSPHVCVVARLAVQRRGSSHSFPGDTGRLLTWDYGHLTTDGAVLVARHMNELGLFR